MKSRRFSPPKGPRCSRLTSAVVGGPGGVADEERALFTGPYEHRLLERVGHNVPQEAAEQFAAAVVSLLG